MWEGQENMEEAPIWCSIVEAVQVENLEGL